MMYQVPPAMMTSRVAENSTSSRSSLDCPPEKLRWRKFRMCTTICKIAAAQIKAIFHRTGRSDIAAANAPTVRNKLAVKPMA